jgi:hypothetical protein
LHEQKAKDRTRPYASQEWHSLLLHCFRPLLTNDSVNFPPKTPKDLHNENSEESSL